MVVGDSVAQGSVDDWTWRYRLWEHLVGTGVDVDFVGPRDDLFDRQGDQFGSHDYADPGFDQDHAARWGMAFASQDHPIGDLVASCRPDVVVEALGINDLTWLGTPPEMVLSAARAFVVDARAADPQVDVVLAELPQTWFTGVTAYNQALPGLASELDTPESRVVAAVPAQELVQDVDTYDPAHLSATGEVKMAAGVADALADIGVGALYPRPLPEVDNGPTRPAVLVASAGDGQVALSWTRPPGATGEVVWIRDATLEEGWHPLPGRVEHPGSSWTATGLIDYHEYQFRLQSAKGSVVAEQLFSNVVAATPQKPAPGPAALHLIARRHRLVARWTSAAGATSYVLTWKRRGEPDSLRSRTTTARRFRIDRVRPGKAYRVTVTPLNDRTPGPTAAALARLRR